MIKFVTLDQGSTFSPLGPGSGWDCFKNQYMIILSFCGCFLSSSVILSIPSQIETKLYYSVITCFVLNTYRTGSSSTSSLKIVSWSRLKLFFVRDFCSCSESCILVFSRIKPYSTAALKLITSHLDFSLDTHHPCYGLLVEEGIDEFTTPLLSPTMA